MRANWQQFEATNAKYRLKAWASFQSWRLQQGCYGRDPVGNGQVVVAPFNFRGLAAPDLLRRAGLVGVSSAKGVTSAGDKAVLDGLRDEAATRALLGSWLACLVAGMRELLSIFQGQPHSLTVGR